MHGALTRKFYGDDCFVVSIMPCTAKKGESLRPQMKGDIDAVLTTRELAKLFRARKIDFVNLKNDSEYDSPLGESTGAGMIFGATGGVLEAALRTALFKLKIDAPIDFKSIRGFDKVKECHIENVGIVCAINGISSVEKLFKENKDWYKKYVMIEVMACVGGCLGGGGEPKFLEIETLQKRMKGIYQIDSNAPKRKSHENKDIIKLYSEHLGKPLSKESEKYLHTKFYKRGSKREMLARFISAVDRKDFDIIDLFEDDGVWVTNSPFGTVNRDKILFVLKKLPAGKHRLAENEGMKVLDINDHVVNFDIVLGPNKLIKKIERIFI
jgi:NADH-quinone oxidoreductase subunit G